MFKLVSQTVARKLTKDLIRTVAKDRHRTHVIRMCSSTSIPSKYNFKMETTYKEPDQKYLVWVDCEMTGLDLGKDKLLEIAVIITDNDLNEVDRLGPLVLNCDERSLDSMNDWCKKVHTKSGLTTKSLESTLTVEMVDNLFFDKLNQHSIKGAVLAGNSISIDNLFIRKYLHRTADLLHYRLLDVSSVKILKE